MEHNLEALASSLQELIGDLPCERPPKATELQAFLQVVRRANTQVAQELAGYGDEREEGMDA